jgi:hypothetical protein
MQHRGGAAYVIWQRLWIVEALCPCDGKGCQGLQRPDPCCCDVYVPWVGGRACSVTRMGDRRASCVLRLWQPCAGWLRWRFARCAGWGPGGR